MMYHNLKRVPVMLKKQKNIAPHTNSVDGKCDIIVRYKRVLLSIQHIQYPNIPTSVGQVGKEGKKVYETHTLTRYEVIFIIDYSVSNPTYEVVMAILSFSNKSCFDS
jgi:hypothetical protein